MPGMAKVLIAKPMIDSKKILVEDQKEYQSGIGMFLYKCDQGIVKSQWWCKFCVTQRVAMCS